MRKSVVFAGPFAAKVTGKVWGQVFVVCEQAVRFVRRLITCFSRLLCRNNSHKILTTAITFIAVIICVLTGGQAYGSEFSGIEKLYSPDSIKIQILSERSTRLVKELGYCEEAALDFAKMVFGWKNTQRTSFVAMCYDRLSEAKVACKQGRISRAKLAKLEEDTARKLGRRIRKEIGFSERFFELSDVIKHRRAQCLGYSQLFYLLGNCVGLSVKAVNVAEPTSKSSSESAKNHMACIVELSSGKIIMVDLVPGGFISMPFATEAKFTQAGDWWMVKDEDSHLKIRGKLVILDRKGIIAQINNNRGAEQFGLGQYTEGIFYYTKAIELNPKYPEAYNNRALAYAKLGQFAEAVRDYNRAIALNPQFSDAYYNRGLTYTKSGRYTQALSDFTKTIELKPGHANAYNNRAAVHIRLGQYAQTICDCSKAIELNPKNAKTYNNRGVAEAFLGRSEEARKDFVKAVKLNPAVKAHIKKVSSHFKLGLELD